MSFHDASRAKQLLFVGTLLWWQPELTPTTDVLNATPVIREGERYEPFVIFSIRQRCACVRRIIGRERGTTDTVRTRR